MANYITKAEYSNRIQQGMYYEGYIEGVGYARTKKEHFGQFDLRALGLSTNERVSFYVQCVDTSPEMVRNSMRGRGTISGVSTSDAVWSAGKNAFSGVMKTLSDGIALDVERYVRSGTYDTHVKRFAAVGGVMRYLRFAPIAADGVFIVYGFKQDGRAFGYNARTATGSAAGGLVGTAANKGLWALVKYAAIKGGKVGVVGGPKGVVAGVIGGAVVGFAGSIIGRNVASNRYSNRNQ